MELVPALPDDLLLIRLAIVTAENLEESWQRFAMRFEHVELSTSEARDANGNPRLMLAAARRLRYRPKVKADGGVVIPERERREAEIAIETAVNLMAISQGTHRSISSPTPAAALLADDDDGREWLAGASYLDLRPPGNGRPQPSWKIELTEEIQKGLADRLDGVALLAEALAHKHLTGRFHEYLRLFERAFARPARNLAEPLAEVLDPRFGYTTGEIEHWLGVLRDPATHADARPVFVLEADVRPVVGRIHQAAFDLLMNKENWRSADTARRELWRAPTGTTGMGNDIFATRGEALAITAQLMDPFDAYPMDLSAIMNPLPAGWWAPMPPSEPAPADGSQEVTT
jgi:hypothetical protein